MPPMAATIIPSKVGTSSIPPPLPLPPPTSSSSFLHFRNLPSFSSTFAPPFHHFHHHLHHNHFSFPYSPMLLFSNFLRPNLPPLLPPSALQFLFRSVVSAVGGSSSSSTAQQSSSSAFFSSSTLKDEKRKEKKKSCPPPMMSIEALIGTNRNAKPEVEQRQKMAKREEKTGKTDHVVFPLLRLCSSAGAEDGSNNLSKTMTTNSRRATTAIHFDGPQNVLRVDTRIEIPANIRRLCRTSSSGAEANVCVASGKVIREVRRGEELILLVNDGEEEKEKGEEEEETKGEVEVGGIAQNSEDGKGMKMVAKVARKRRHQQQNHKRMSFGLTPEEKAQIHASEAAKGADPATSKGFRCPHCGKVFSYEYYRDKHLKFTRCVDNGQRQFPCHLCPRSFEKRDRLRIHVLHVHERYRPHVCPLCPKAFSQSSSLNKHLRTHSGERPYQCPHCEKAFTASSILRTHIRQHSGEKPFKCAVCGKNFASHAAHDSHARRTHQQQ